MTVDNLSKVEIFSSSGNILTSFIIVVKSGSQTKIPFSSITKIFPFAKVFDVGYLKLSLELNLFIFNINIMIKKFKNI